MRASFAIPGDLATRTGGYGYARRLIAEAPGAGLELEVVRLPDVFPAADRAAITESLEMLDAARPPVLVDGLALGTLPADGLAGLAKPLVALCHHPLGLETGLAPDRAAALVASEREALAQCRRVITTSRTTAETLIAGFDVAGDRITVALPGTEPAPRAQGSDDGTVQILSVGSIVPRKGHRDLVAALAGLKAHGWYLDIAGSPDRDPAEAEALRDAITATGLGGRIKLVGELDDAALARAYGRADLFVLASHYEGFGMAFTEALARGLPVIGCDGGAVAEAVATGGAVLVPPGDVAALRAALEPLIADGEARAALAAAAWEGARALPRWNDTAAAVAGALREAVR